MEGEEPRGNERKGTIFGAFMFWCCCYLESRDAFQVFVTDPAYEIQMNISAPEHVVREDLDVIIE